VPAKSLSVSLFDWTMNNPDFVFFFGFSVLLKKGYSLSIKTEFAETRPNLSVIKVTI